MSISNLQIAKALRTIESKACVLKAESLEQKAEASSVLNLRDLGLTSDNVFTIASCFRQEEAIQSISFSYNSQMGDDGTIALIKNLPKATSELGLVSCGIGDAGGQALLKWMRGASNLKMVCVERNNFTEEIRVVFKLFSKNHPDVLLVY